MTTITSLPTPPSRNDPGTFSSRTDALLGALPTFVAETNAIAGEVNANAATATTQAGVATTQAGIAAAEAAAAVATAANVAAIAGAAAWVSGNTYAYPDTAISPTTFQTYRKKTASSVTTTDPSADSTNWEPVSTGGVGLLRDARTSNVKLSAAEFGRFIDITSGSFTQTFAAAVSLGDGWWCYLRNSGTGDITLDPNGAEQIDGLTSYVMYPGECRLVQCDGAALRTVVLNAFYKVFIESGAFIKPPGYMEFAGLLWAGGGSGRKHSTASNKTGGSGGACAPISMPSAALSVTEIVVIGTGGAAVSTDATNGNAGGYSTFNKITAYGGKAGSTNPSVGGGAIYDINTAVSQPLGGAVGGMGFYGGGGSSLADDGKSNTVYGGGGGGGINNTDVIFSSATTYGGAGGAAVVAGAGVDGSAPGGGGGATKTGAQSGAGARGELRIWGVI